MNKRLLKKFSNDVQGLSIYGQRIIYKDSHGNVFIIGNKSDDLKDFARSFDLLSIL